MSTGSSPYSFGGGNKARRRGSHEKVTTKARGEDAKSLKDERVDSPVTGHPSPDATAVVGASVTVGMSTEFAREKVEISCWESRPAADNPHDRERVKSEIVQGLQTEAMEMLDSSIRQFFPHMLDQT